MKTSILAIILLFVLVPNMVKTQSLEAQLETLLDSVYSRHHDALGILIHVESPKYNLSWTKAVGFSDSARTEILLADQPVLIASNTKTYVSAAILRLVEESLLVLDTSIANLLHENTRNLLQNDGYDLSKITVRQLLSHTSGIKDYVNKEYFKIVIQNPQYQWTREDQIRRSIKIGDPQFEPGTAFSYGDINYLLLTEILENITQKPFYLAIRELLKYDEIELSMTWFKDLESEPVGVLPFAHQYAENFLWDSYHLNHSWDRFGGGGIASTTKDAALFYQHLFEGKIIHNNEVLAQMYDYVLPHTKSKYCLGLYHFDFGYPLYYHGGWWGTDVNYSPLTNTSIAVFTLVKEKRTEINPFLGKRIQEIVKGMP